MASCQSSDVSSSTSYRSNASTYRSSSCSWIRTSTRAHSRYSSIAGRARSLQRAVYGGHRCIQAFGHFRRRPTEHLHQKQCRSLLRRKTSSAATNARRTLSRSTARWEGSPSAGTAGLSEIGSSQCVRGCWTSASSTEPVGPSSIGGARRVRSESASRQTLVAINAATRVRRTRRGLAMRGSSSPGPRPRRVHG